jgi:PAS domain S-box-containing protein
VTQKGDENELLRSVALQNASSVLAARRRAERRSEVFLEEAQRLSHTGSFGWKPSTSEIIWSEETFRIFQYDGTITPTVELALERVHPADALLAKQTFQQAAQDRKDFEYECRLLMPNGAVKHVHVVAHAERDESGEVEFIGAVMDVTESKRAETNLRRSESYLAEAQRLTHTGSWVWRVAGRDLLHLSEEWYRIYGFDPKNGLPTWEERLHRVHPEDRPKWREAIDRAIAEESEYEVEFRILLADGTVKYIHSVGHPVLNASGNLTEFVGSSTDITERKQAEVLLAGEKRLLEMIAKGDSRELILDGACLLVEELASGSLCSILLFDPGANRLRHGAAPSLPKIYTETIDGIVIGPSVGSCGTAAYRAETVIVSDISSDPLWADFRDLALAHGLRACWSTPILSSAGRVLGTFATYHREPHRPSSPELNAIERITHLASIAIERKHAEEKLRQSESYLAEAQRLSHTGSWAGAPRMGEIRYWSEECYRVLGFDPRAGQPRVETFFQRIHPDDQAKTSELLEKAGREKAEFAFDYRIIHPGGEIRSIHTVGHPVFGPSGDLVEFVGTVIDVTERKRAEEERETLRQAQADLARVNRVTTMGELTASLAHEVNQPIAAALTNATTCVRWLTRDTPDLEEARAAAMRIVKDQTRAAEIVSRIRLLFNKGIPQWELVDVNEVIREMSVLLSGETTRYFIDLRTKLPADLPPVMGDRVQLQQVMMNLMVNGIDAMKNADGPRELAIQSQRVENRELLVSVSDTGIGLPPQQTEQIFNAFFTTKPHGTGMGLRISRSIVESHGGRLWAANNPHRGASFYFTLPTKAEATEI